MTLTNAEVVEWEGWGQEGGRGGSQTGGGSRITKR